MNRIFLYSVVVCITLYMNFIIYSVVTKLFFPHKVFSKILSFCNIFASATFFIRMLFHRYLIGKIYNFCSVLGSTWLFVIFYMFVFYVFYQLIQFLDYQFNFLPVGYKLFNKNIQLWYLLFIVCFVGILMKIGKTNFNTIKIRNFSQKSEVRLSKNYRIVMISDVHLGKDIGLDMLRDYVKQINNLKPDVLVIAGDLFDFYVEPLYNAGVVDEFKKIKTKYGVYYALGNHEYYAKEDAIVKTIAQESGFHLLKDAYEIINDELLILGRDDYHNKNRLLLENICCETVQKFAKFKIAIDHNPKEIGHAVDAGFNCIFAGHTHNGQLFPANFLVKLLYKYAYGLFKPKEHCCVYVSSGLGIWGPTFRLGSQSEIVVFDIS